MKTSKVCLSLLVALAVLSLASNAWASTILAQWTFETSLAAFTSNTGTSPTGAPFSPEVGTGSATSVHASASTVWTAPAGNPPDPSSLPVSTKSLSSEHWGVGDYTQFGTDTTGFSGISVSWDETGSNTGPRDFVLQYSPDGTNFTTFGSAYTITSDSWNTATYKSASHHSVDVSSITALDNVTTAYFRLTDNSATNITGGVVATGGTHRADNLTIIGATAVPEPTTLVLGAIGLGLAGFVGARRYRRR